MSGSSSQRPSLGAAVVAGLLLVAVSASLLPGLLFAGAGAAGQAARGRSLRAPRQAAVSVADFAAAVADCNAGFCDRPFTATKLLKNGALEIKEERRGTTDPTSPPKEQSERFWATLAAKGSSFEGKSEEWHDELYWRLVRAQNCHVIASQAAFAYNYLKGSTACELEYEGEPVIDSFIMQGHVRVGDMLEKTPDVYLQYWHIQAYPTYSSIGRQYQLLQDDPRAAEKFGILAKQRQVLENGMRLCSYLDEEPQEVVPHTWFVLATENYWFHVDLCGMAYGYQGRTEAGWPLHTFVTRAYDLVKVRAGQWGSGTFAVETDGVAYKNLQEDAQRLLAFSAQLDIEVPPKRYVPRGRGRCNAAATGAGS
eukprot:TRINITY_DN35678_c0_g1_i1.p1 TRINITY_DN35678_c0_g1~~TRINITY_DN35678_c0_g1_i1.p1  ORF type:complete len:367 (+),score=91.49 TRINITY_DN35678_c0_g1_i1:128-1228(+)